MYLERYYYGNQLKKYHWHMQDKKYNTDKKTIWDK